MLYWSTNTPPFNGQRYEDVEKQVKMLFANLKSMTKRKVHIKSKYFKRDKVFFDYFWQHLFQKSISQRRQRARLLPCAIELIENSTYTPEIKVNPNKKSETFFRFYGKTQSGQKFSVQIKEHQKRKNKQFMSVFPLK